MKKILLFLAFLVFYSVEIYSQASFNTNAIRADVNQYGRIRIYSPDDVRQIERASILVGTSPTTVFDYTNDAGTLDPTILVASPVSSDFEIYGSYDNSYSSLPPDVIEKINAYGWNDKAFSIIKFNIKNNGTSAFDAIVGLDIIPYINEEYGYDTVTYNPTEEVIRFHRGPQENVGMKLLSSTLTSLYSFEWYDGYPVDSDYWTWMNHGSLQPQYISTTADGPVAISSQGPVTLDPGATMNVYYAMAIGADEQAMLNNMEEAVAKYEEMITSVENLSSSGNTLRLDQNYPNPFKNSTSISYQLPADGFVSIKVYNLMGNEVTTLVNSNQTRGIHTIPFQANDLSSGVYYYKIMFNDQIKSNKMFLIK
jgi:hypothetical protein